ncbi:MAG: hypothetical protein WBV36_08475 [Terriglobales bacterium]
MKIIKLAHANVLRSLLLALVLLSLVLFAGCNSANFNPPAESIAATSGTPQSTALNTAFAAPLVATVTMGSTPVAGAFVVFTAPAAGASGTFANGTNTETDTTNSSGVATSTTLTANGTIGADTVTASVAGVTATTTFSLTNTSGPAAAVLATSGSLQDATVGTAFAAPLVATVVDSNQNPVSGASVTFTAPTSGASGTFANATTTETDTTNSSGMATSSTFAANSTVGGYAVTASTAGATPANFNLTNITGAVISITATSGTPQSATVNAAFAAPLVATVMANGAPVSGALVTFEVPTVGASGTFAGGVNMATTNASGVATSATFTANGSVGTYTVTATVASGAQPANFILTNTAINYAFYVSGLEALNQDFNGGPSFYALAGSVTVDGNGNVLGGEQDYNDGLGLNSPEPLPDNILPAAAALVVDPTTGQGTLTLTTDNPNLGQSGVETLGVQFVNTNHALIIQFDGSATSSGSMDTQTLSSALNDGNYAFTLTGVDPSYETIVFGGVFSISAGGTSLQGTFDVDDAGAATTPTLGTSFSGAITGPDAFGRGSITSGLAMTLNYYIVGPEAIRIIDVDVDAGDSAIGSAYGQGTGTFSDASLGSSIFGVQSNSFGNLYAAAGMFATAPGDGTLSGVADDNEYYNGVIAPKASISGNYAVASNGYGSLTLTPGDLGDVSVFGIYMTDPLLNLNDPNNTTSGLGGGLVAELDGFDLSGTGVLIPQTDTATGSFAGPYAFGAQADNDARGPNLGWEFDFVGQGSVSGGVFSGATGLLSDPFFIFDTTPPDGTDTATFTGTATPDLANAGRYTMKLGVTVSADPSYNLAIYQANGGQLLWLDENANGESVFLGSLQQQGSLAGLPAAKRARSKVKSRRRQ